VGNNKYISKFIVIGKIGGNSAKNGEGGTGAPSGNYRIGDECKNYYSNPGSGGGGGGGGNAGAGGNGGSASAGFNLAEIVLNGPLQVISGGDGTEAGENPSNGLGGNGGGSLRLEGSNCYAKSNGGNGNNGMAYEKGRGGNAEIKASGKTIVVNSGMHVWEVGQSSTSSFMDSGVSTLKVGTLKIQNSASVTLNLNCANAAKCIIDIQNLDLSGGGKFSVKRLAGDPNTKVTIPAQNIKMTADSEVNFGTAGAYDANNINTNKSIVRTSSKISNPTTKANGELPKNSQRYSPVEMKAFGNIQRNSVANNISVEFSRSMRKSSTNGNISLKIAKEDAPGDIATFNYATSNGVDVLNQDPAETTSKAFFRGSFLVVPLRLFKCESGCAFMNIPTDASPLTVNGHLPYESKVEVNIPAGLFETNVDIQDASRRTLSGLTYYFYTAAASADSVNVNVAGTPGERATTADVGEEVTFDATITTSGNTWPLDKPAQAYNSIKWEMYGVKNQMTQMPEYVNYENVIDGGNLYGDTSKYSISRSTNPSDCGPPSYNASNDPKGTWYGCIDKNVETVRNTIKISPAETSSAIFVVAKSTYDNSVFGFGVITVGGRVKTNVDILPTSYDIARGLPSPLEIDPGDPENGQSVIEATIEIAKGADNTIIWELGGNTDANSGIYMTSGGQSSASRTLETSANDTQNCEPVDGKPIDESTTFKCKIYVFAGADERSPILTLRAYSRFASSAQDFLMINVLDVGVLALQVTPPMVTITAGTEQMFDVSAMEGLGYQELTPDQYDNLNVYWEVLTPTDPATQVREITDGDGKRHAILKVGREEMSPQLILIARNRINNELYGYSSITVEQTLSGVVHINEQDLVLSRNTDAALSASVQLPAAFDSSLFWQVVGNTDASTQISAPTTPHGSPNTSIHIGNNEPFGGAILVVAQSLSDPSISGYAIIRVESASEPMISINPSVQTMRVEDVEPLRTQVFTPTLINSASDTKAVVYELIGASAGTTLTPSEGATLLAPGQTIAAACTALGVKTVPGNATFVLGQNEGNQAVYIRSTMCSHQGKSAVAEVRVRGYKLQSIVLAPVSGTPTYVTHIDDQTVQLEQNAPDRRIVKLDAVLDLPNEYAASGFANNEYIDWSIEGASAATAFCTSDNTPSSPCATPVNDLAASDSDRPSVLDQLRSRMTLSVDPDETTNTILIKACSKFNPKLCAFASVKLVNKASTGLRLDPRDSEVNVSSTDLSDHKVQYHAIITQPSNLSVETIPSAGVKWELSGATSLNTRLENASGGSCDQASGTRSALEPCYLVVDDYETSSMLIVKATSLYSEQMVDFAEVKVQKIVTSGLSITKFAGSEVTNDNRNTLSHAVGECVPIEAYNYSSHYISSDIRFKVNGATAATSFYASQADCESQSDIVNLGQDTSIVTTSDGAYKKTTAWIYISENENNPSFTITACIADNNSLCDIVLVRISGASNSGVTITPAQKDVTTGEIVDLDAHIYQPPGADRFIFWELQGSDGGSRLIDKDYYDETGGDFRACSPKSYTDQVGLAAFGEGHDFTKCALYVSPDETSYLLLVTARLNFDAQQRFTAVFNVLNHIASAVYFAPMYLRAAPNNDYTFYGQVSLPALDLEGLSDDEINAMVATQNEKRKAIRWSLSGELRDSYIYTIVKNEDDEDAMQLGCEDTTICYLHVAHDEPNGTLTMRAQSKLNGSRLSIGTVDVRSSSTSGVRACSTKEVQKRLQEAHDATLEVGEEEDIDSEEILGYEDIWNTCEHVHKVDAGSAFELDTNVSISKQEYLEDPETSPFSNYEKFGTHVVCELYGGVKGTSAKEVVLEDEATGRKHSICEVSVSKYEIASELSLIIRSKIDPMKTDRVTILVTKRALNGVEISPKVDVKMLPGQELSFTAIVRDLTCKPDDDYFYDSDLSVDDFVDFQEDLGALCGENEVEWSVKGETAGTEVMQNGVLKVSPNETARHITVLATSKYDKTRFDAVVVEIVNRNTAGVRIFPDLVDVSTGQGQAFTHETYLPESNAHSDKPADTSVSWSVNGGIHSTTIDANTGFLQISPSETASNLLVLARSNYDQTLIGYAMVNVKDIVEPQVSILTDTQDLEYGQQLAIDSKVVVPSDQDDSVTWSIYGNTSPATTISPTGVLSIASDEESKSISVNITSNWNQQLQDTKSYHINRDVYTPFDFESSVHAMASILDANNALEAGAVPTFVKNSNSDLKFATGYSYKEAEGILVNNEQICEDCYSLLEVSGDYLAQHPETLEKTSNGKSFEKDINEFNHYTLITLKANYLEDLDLGDHALRLKVKGVDANSAPFRVVDVNFSAPEKLIYAPKNYVLLIVFLVMLLCAGGVALLHSRGVLTKLKTQTTKKFGNDVSTHFDVSNSDLNIAEMNTEENVSKNARGSTPYESSLDTQGGR
jgi:hypothetical protein